MTSEIPRVSASICFVIQEVLSSLENFPCCYHKVVNTLSIPEAILCIKAEMIDFQFAKYKDNAKT